MALDKSALKSAIIEWMEKGAAGDFSLLVDGVLWFQDVCADYWKNGADSLTNKVQAMDASLMAVALLTLVPTDLTVIPSTQLATGAVNSWTGKTLATTILPPDGLSAVSNNITATSSIGALQPDFKDILDADFAAIMNAAPIDIAKNVYLRMQLAEMWADALEKAATDCTWLYTYIQNIPPLFPTNTLTGNVA